MFQAFDATADSHRHGRFAVATGAALLVCLALSLAAAFFASSATPAPVEPSVDVYRGPHKVSGMS